MNTTTASQPLAPLPSRLPSVGTIIAAIPVHAPVNDRDPTEWVVVCDRGSQEPELAGDARRYSTNKVQRLGDEVLGHTGHYDLTYLDALADMHERAGSLSPARTNRVLEKLDFWIGNLTLNAEHQRENGAPGAKVQATMTRATDFADLRKIVTGEDW